MATLWFVRDGSRPSPDQRGPYTQSGPGIAITTSEAEEILGGSKVIYVGLEGPSINPGPVKGSERHVVIELEEGDALSSTFAQVGFYFASAIRSSQAQERLEALRAAD